MNLNEFQKKTLTLTQMGFFIFSFLLITSCTSSRQTYRPTAKVSPKPFASIAPSPLFTINSVTPTAKSIDQPIDQNNPLQSLVVNFKVSSDRTTSNLISQSCNLLPIDSPAAKPCTCIFKWDEKNRTNPKTDPVVIKREIQTQVTAIQPNLVVCQLPPAYQFEIPEGANIQLTITRSNSMLADFESLPFNFPKRTPGAAGDFQDINGNTFDNILRYSCYERFSRGMSIRNRRVDPQDRLPDKPLFRFNAANSFCVSKADGSNNAQEGCEDVPSDVDFSSESYYYNLYIPSAQKGKINQDNKRYKCPLVKENLANKPQGDFWPLDSSFSLSRNRTDEFVVGIEGFSNISIEGGDASSLSTSCTPPKKTGDNQNNGENNGDQKVEPNTLVKKCLGFGLKTKPDGTCPYFRGANNEKIPTFRLRRFVALYPPNFDSDGRMRNEPQGIDVIYVIDRPIKKSANADSSDNPFTMLGPKPCPFAYFDHKNTTNSSAAHYLATNNILWSGPDGRGVNVDGIELPRTDSFNSCAAAIPLFNPETEIWSVGTVSESNPAPRMKHVYIRPIKPWSPHYEEDTDFQACAPFSKPFVDPPLHFSKDPNNFNVSWCAEAYPTQNPNRGIDPDPATGKVQPFTSHVIKNTDLSLPIPLCTGRDLGHSNYAALSAGKSCTVGGKSTIASARHPNYLVADLFKTNQQNCESFLGSFNPADQNCLMCSHLTCDRTWQSSQTQTWIKFPLLAPAEDVERALNSDTTYGCTVTYDDGGGKTGKFSPREGCCGTAVKMISGNVENNPLSQNTSAHLEPGPSGSLCKMPQY